jgi:hypothetical protein
VMRAAQAFGAVDTRDQPGVFAAIRHWKNEFK